MRGSTGAEDASTSSRDYDFSLKYESAVLAQDIKLHCSYILALGIQLEDHHI